MLFRPAVILTLLTLLISLLAGVYAGGAKTLHNYVADGQPEDAADTQTTWLAGGLPHTVSLGRGGSTTFGYTPDGARDLESITWPAASSQGFAAEPFYSDTIGLGRDAAGNIDSITDRSGERDLAYEKNRLTTTDWLGGELDDYAVARAYDPQGRLDSVTLSRKGAALHSIEFGYTGKSDEINGVTAEGFSASYARDAANRAVTGVTRGPVVQTWGRGAAGRIASAGSNVAGAPDFGYATFDSKGRRKTVVTNKGTWTYTYRGGDGGDGQLVSASATGNDLGTFAYGFDGIGRRVDFAANQGDPLNRFLGMTHPQVPKNLYISADPEARVWFNGIELHQAPDDFDGFTVAPLGHPGPAGGWVQWEVEGVVEDAGEPGAHDHAVAEFSGHVYFPPTQEDFAFDADGNRESSALWDYGWDGRNRLVRSATRDRLTAPEGWDLRFDYDAEGRRFKKEVIRYEDGVPGEHKVIHFVWDGWDLIYERHQDGFGNLLFDRKYVWGPDAVGTPGPGVRRSAGGAGGLLLMRETRGQSERDFYPLYDGSGHVVGLADDNGELVAEYWWGPFGELIEARGEMADANPWRYATKYYDKETGLYYFGHRYYDPVTGQWMNREPLGEDESLNLYAYCHNDPINKIDILGLREAGFWGWVNKYIFLAPDPIVLRESSASRKAREERAQQRLDEMLVLERYSKGELSEFDQAYMDFVFAEQAAAQEAAFKAWEDHQSLPGMYAPDNTPIVHTAALTIGAPVQSPAYAEANAGFLLPVGAGAWAVQGGVRSFQVLNFMRAGYSFQGARALQSVGTELRTGTLLAHSGPEVWQSAQMDRFIASPQFAALSAEARALAPGNIGAKSWQQYERSIRGVYGNTTFAQRQYQAIIDGQLFNGVADSVATVGGKSVAVEAKFVSGSWANLIRNPASAIASKPFAKAERLKMVNQARRYAAAFDEVVYHTTSVELMNHYSRVFQKFGLDNVRFVYTP